MKWHLLRDPQGIVYIISGRVGLQLVPKSTGTRELCVARIFSLSLTSLFSPTTNWLIQIMRNLIAYN